MRLAGSIGRSRLVRTSAPLRVMTVFGTRPDAIKMAPVVAALEAARPAVQPIVCVTAQHREMLDEILALFKIQPHFDLNIMRREQTLGDITTNVLNGLGPVLTSCEPDVLLVHGDTTTSVAAALAAFYNKIPIGHVEAGLRTGNRNDPFPEEMNRRLVGALASYHFAPTPLARENLLAENVAEDAILVTGNTVIDAFLATARRSEPGLPSRWEEFDPERPVIFVTAHRRENHEAIRGIALAVRDASHLPSRPQFYWPVHPSPRVAPIVRGVLEGTPGVVLVGPIDYAHLVSAIRRSLFVLTDSGGLQEEAPCLGKPVLVMRETTERPEGLRAGTLELIGSERTNVARAIERLLTDRAAYDAMSHANNPYGDGHAADRIVQWLLATTRHGLKPDAFQVVA